MGNVVMQNVTIAIAQVLHYLLYMYWWIVVIAVLLTWVNPDPYNPIVRFLRSATEPVFYQIRRRLPFVVIGGFDLSPIVVLLLVQVIDIVVVDSLFKLAMRMTAALSPAVWIG